jgi:hypothetical protein
MIPQNIKTKFSSTLMGILSPSIPYEVRNPSGTWQDYFGTYESQKHDDLDSNCCWAFAGNECLEDQLEFLWKKGQLSMDTMDWFKKNGYIDSDGDFYLSRRFIPIMSGVKRNGNDEAEFWWLTEKYGAIPNALLPYTSNDEYFDASKITPQMIGMGKEFLRRITVVHQDIGARFFRKDVQLLQSALFQAELQIGIPVPQDGSWNETKVRWNGVTQAQHSVALYKVDPISDPEFPYYIYDQYMPYLKQLSKDYFITICTQGVVSPKITVVPSLVPQTTLGARMWRAVWEFFQFNPKWVQA